MAIAQKIQYNIGYDYYWNCFEYFNYRGRIVGGISVNVLFSPIFEYAPNGCDTQENCPEQKLDGNYLFEYFKPVFNKKGQLPTH